MGRFVEEAQSLFALLADDNPGQQRAISAMLGAMNCSVEIAANGAQAVQLAQTRRYDVIFLDYSMPMIDGIEAARRVRASEGKTGRAATPLFLVSSQESHDLKAKAAAAGATGYLTKPVSAALLLDAIQMCARNALDPLQEGKSFAQGATGSLRGGSHTAVPSQTPKSSVSETRSLVR